MTLAEILAALQGKPSGAAQPVRTTPEGGLDLRAILAGAQIGQTAKSPYERTMRPGETRSAGDVQDMLAEVILAAGSGALPGVGPRGQARQAPARVRPGFEKQFKEWFGGSKIVNEKGEPLTVYKGMYPYDYTKETATSPGPLLNSINRPSELPAFNRGEPGVKVAGFFGTKDVANQFAEGMGTRSAVYPAHLKMERPFVIDAKGKKAGEIQFGGSGAGFRDAVRSGKYDGVIIKNTADEGTVYVALKPENIKSATGNRGTYDPNSPRIDE